MSDFLIDPDVLATLKKPASSHAGSAQEGVEGDVVSGSETRLAVRVVMRETPIPPETGAHSHPQGQLIGAVSGLLSISTDHGKWVVPAINAFWVPPGMEHGLVSHGPFRGWSVYVGPHLCAGLPDYPRALRTSELLMAAIRRAAGWGDGPQSDAEARIARIILDEIATTPKETLGLPMPKDLRLVRLAQALMADLSDGRSMTQWADWAGIPCRTLGRRMLRETGFGFGQWRTRARMLAALEMLAGGLSVTTVALDLGYENISAFIAAFRKTYGVTPARYFAPDGQ